MQCQGIKGNKERCTNLCRGASFCGTHKSIADCTICMDPIRARHRYSITICRHYFHDKCLSSWQREEMGHTCPTCRTQISEPIEVHKGPEETLRFEDLPDEVREWVFNDDEEGGSIAALFFASLLIRRQHEYNRESRSSAHDN